MKIDRESCLVVASVVAIPTLISKLTIEEMALLRFVRIDFDNGTIISLDKKVERDNTKISKIKQLEEVTVLQGVEQRGWALFWGKIPAISP